MNLRDIFLAGAFAQGGGGAVSPEQITEAVNNYLEKNPVSGISADATDMLIDILSGVYYKTDKTDKINTLRALLLNQNVPGFTKYAVTATLVNCEIDNTASEVIAGNSYIATISPVSDAYVMDSVTVTMGGESVAVSDGKIEIAKVTGDIAIDAVAVIDDIAFSVGETILNGNFVDTGFSIGDKTKEWTMCLDIETDSTSANYGVFMAADRGTNVNFRARIENTSYVFRHASNLKTNMGTKATQSVSEKMVIRHTANAETVDIFGENISKTTSGTIATWPSTSVTIGGALDAYGNGTVVNSVNGILHSAVIYKRALTDDEITAYLGGES